MASQQVYEIHCRSKLISNAAADLPEEESCTIQASYNKAELHLLYDKANSFATEEFRKRRLPSKTVKITKAYRVKKRQYFEDARIGSTNFGVMEPHLKNNHGHHENNINHFLKGIFFSTQIQYNGKEFDSSFFGDSKMVVPIDELLKETNLYFADFYCNGTRGTNPHYMTIVVCKKGSESDRYCATKLLPLPQPNDFLRIRETNGITDYFNSYTIWMELFFTENWKVDLNCLESIEYKDYGSRGDGAQNKINCLDCNIYLP